VRRRSRFFVDSDFGNWLAGFIDGEGCFYITRDRKRSPYRARFSIALRADDRPILEEVRAVTGIGTIHDYTASSTGSRTTRWMVQSYTDCATLKSILDRYPLRAKKRNDFDVWSRALVTQGDIATGRLANNDEVNSRMAALKEELAVVRRKGLDV
jgi:hypothetical protein